MRRPVITSFLVGAIVVAGAGCTQATSATTSTLRHAAPVPSSRAVAPAPSATSTTTAPPPATTATTTPPTTSTPPNPPGLQVGPGPQDVYSVEPQPAPGTCHYSYVGVDPLPDPHCTPGAISPAVTQSDIAATICSRGYTSTVRPPEDVTGPEKEASASAYGYTGPFGTAKTTTWSPSSWVVIPTTPPTSG